MPVGQVELAALPGSPDWREPGRRRGVFQDFYEFTARTGSFPGCVYYLIPYLRSELGWDDEQTLWFAFLNANTQHPLSSLLMHRRGSRPSEAAALVDWYRDNRQRLSWDTDRRYHRRVLGESVQSYLELLAGRPQMDFWMDVAEHGFSHVWRAASSIVSFGRLSAWSYCDYLHISGIPINCRTLMLADQAGSRSHRNGLCIVSGLDVYDWHQSNPSFNGRYPRSLLQHLGEVGESLYQEARDRAEGFPWARDVTYLTLESALCTYKSWHRPNRRYPNVYNDMLHDRIQATEAAFPEEDLTVFWRAREACLPRELRLEDNPGDPGLSPVKQNHYRLTGEVVMMDADWERYDNAFSQAVREGLFL